MNELFGEFLGTFILILLGNGVVANVNLNKTYSFGAGWIVITAGWGMAVFVAVLAVSDISGAHINPAVTIGLALSGIFPWIKVVPFIVAQMLGAMLGAAMVYLYFINHFKITSDPRTKRNCFCTSPAIRNYKSNFLSEAVGTFILVISVLLIHLPSLNIPGIDGAKVGLGSLEALPVGLIVFSIGLSLGGTTGYAINPARDLGPRIVHFLVPMENKDSSDWRYAWIPSIGPVVGAVIASGVYFFILYLNQTAA
jgi:glycerol uptake facilitator protein